MTDFKAGVRASLMILAAGILSACGGGGENTPPMISVSISGGSSQTIEQGQSVAITAVVSNDSAGKGVTWVLTGPGALSKQTSTTVEYDAPASVESNLTASVTATAVADSTKSAADTVTVTYPPVALVQVSADAYSGGLGQHATEVEPDTFAFGPTIVSTFQVSRIFGGGAMNVGFATSTDGGVTWTSGVLPGITTSEGGSFDGAGDPVVTYDAAHGEWLIATIALHEDASGNIPNDQVLVSRSADGLNWENPIAANAVASPRLYDKDWIVCDDTSTSPYYGHCYLQWRGTSGLMNTSTSSDGGLTWPSPLLTTDAINGGSGQPLVQPNGTVISPMLKLAATDMLAFTSTNGGTSWSATTEISPISDHEDAGNLRSNPIGSAEMDAAGTVYYVWQDCRFRTNCASNDIVLTTSSDGVTWTVPARVPIDPVTSTVDHFFPGLAVDRSTSGSGAHLTLLYYYYPVTNCGTDCDLYVGFVESEDGGQTWSAPVVLAGPMKLPWVAQSGDTVATGYMVGDYFSVSYVNGNPFAVFAVATANSGSTFNEGMYTTAAPMVPAVGTARLRSRGEKPVPNAKSDHPPRHEGPPRHNRLVARRVVR
ncbi:MAG TPA: sialidase family protein [Candidatus Limnocylindrales bacterium]|nr:sialidase family protein [Candidatus Limnocylindrales bacterium]